MCFDWDSAKSDRSWQARGFGFDFATLIFAGDTIEWPDDRRDYGEARVRAIGEVDGMLLHVVLTDRRNVRRIVSARVADKMERSRWHASR